MNIEDAWFMYGTQILSSSGTCLRDYSITNGSTIDVNLKLQGGSLMGLDFCDLAADPHKHKWSAGPEWRLFLEGCCTNRKCKTFGKGKVVMKKGYVEFELVEDSYKCKCPVCNKHVDPHCMWL